MAKTGGHLGSSLGVVELSLALHYVFNTPEDKIIWDVGHQAYIHKMLTGRRSRMHTIRQQGGLSGAQRGLRRGAPPAAQRAAAVQSLRLLAGGELRAAAAGWPLLLPAHQPLRAACCSAAAARRLHQARRVAV